MSYLAFLLSAVMISPSDVMAPGKAPAERLAALALLAGILLTAAHPYFLLWGASVGAQLVINGVAFGLLGFAVFAVAHWLRDLAWLWFPSVLAYNGGQFFGWTFQRVTFGVCGVFPVGMSAKFMADAVRLIRA